MRTSLPNLHDSFAANVPPHICCMWVRSLAVLSLLVAPCNMLDSNNNEIIPTLSAVAATSKMTVAEPSKDSWRRYGEAHRRKLLAQEEHAGRTHFDIQSSCPISQYWSLADRVRSNAAGLLESFGDTCIVLTHYPAGHSPIRRTRRKGTMARRLRRWTPPTLLCRTGFAPTRRLQVQQSTQHL